MKPAFASSPRILLAAVMVLAGTAAVVFSAQARAEVPGNQTAVCCALPPDPAEEAENAARFITGSWYVPEADIGITYEREDGVGATSGTFRLQTGHDTLVPLANIHGTWRVVEVQYIPYQPNQILITVEHSPLDWLPEVVCTALTCEPWVQTFLVPDTTAPDVMFDEAEFEFQRR